MSDYLVSEDFDYLHDAPADAPEPETGGFRTLADQQRAWDLYNAGEGDAPEPETAEPTPVVIAWETPCKDGSVGGVYDVGTIRFYVVHYLKTRFESESFYVNVYDTNTGAADAGVVKLLSEEKVIRHLTFWRDTLAAMTPPF